MLLPRKWVLSLGLLAAVPSISVAGPLDFLKPGEEQKQSSPALQESANTNQNQKVAENIAKALSRANLVHQDVSIEYKSGVATIGGQIKNEAQRALVTRLVSRVPGVETVENSLSLMETTKSKAASPIQQAAAVSQGAPNRRVQPVAFDQKAARSNQEVAQNIAESLTSAGLSGYDIEVRYKNGVASLIGNVENPSQVALAQQATGSVPGVGEVLNQLRVKGQPVQVAQRPPGQPQFAPQGRPQFGPQGPYGQRPQGQPQFGPQGPQFGPRGPIQQTQGVAPQGQQRAPRPGMVPPGPGYAPQGPPAPVQSFTNPGNAAQAGHQVYNQPNLPDYAWPSYAQYDNYSAVSYPSQYDASAFPYIGPYYPYPQVPMGWRSSTLEWDDGSWNLTFDSRTDRWWWFMNPKNW